MAIDEENLSEPATATIRKSKLAGGKRRTKNGAGRKRRAAGRAQSTQARPLARGYGRKASGLVRHGRRLVDDAYGWVDEARSAVPRIAGNRHLPSARRLESFAKANSVILGAVGLGIGVIIGALLPRDAFHTGMQGLGLASASSPASPRSRKTTRERARK